MIDSEGGPTPQDMGLEPEEVKIPEQKAVSDKLELSENQRKMIEGALDEIGAVLDALERGEEDVAYADTGDSMETIDSILGNDQAYSQSLGIRREASTKAMRGSEEEKKEGIRQAGEWLESVKVRM